MKDLSAPVSIPIPAGVKPTMKENGMYCVTVEGSFEDGILSATKVMANDSKEPDMPKSKVKKKKERSARLKAILGEDDGGAY